MTADPLATALFGKSMRAILAQLFGRPDRTFYLREIARAAGTPPSSLQRELATLARAGIIRRNQSGRQVYYQADSRCPIFEELKGIAAKTFGVAQTLREILRPQEKHIRAAFIYGSIADGTAAAGSDIDLMVIGDLPPSQISVDLGDARERLGRSVSTVVYSVPEFVELIARENDFISRILHRPVIWLIGDRETVDALGPLESRKSRAHKAAKR